MNLQLESLPSRGHNYPASIKNISITELDFSQLCKYTSKNYPRGSASELLHDIECLIKDLPNYQFISLFDVSSIIFMRKYISATYEDTAIIPVGDKSYKLSISDINFKVISDKLINTKSLILNGNILKFNIGTVLDLESVLERYIDSDYEDESITLGTLMLIASLGGWNAANLVFHATKEDAALVKEYSDLLEDQYNDVTIKPDDSEGGDAVIRINYLITDIFRFIKLNSKVDEEQIITK